MSLSCPSVHLSSCLLSSTVELSLNLEEWFPRFVIHSLFSLWNFFSYVVSFCSKKTNDAHYLWCVSPFTVFLSLLKAIVVYGIWVVCHGSKPFARESNLCGDFCLSDEMWRDRNFISLSYCFSGDLRGWNHRQQGLASGYLLLIKAPPLGPYVNASIARR